MKDREAQIIEALCKLGRDKNNSENVYQRALVDDVFFENLLHFADNPPPLDKYEEALFSLYEFANDPKIGHGELYKVLLKHEFNQCHRKLVRPAQNYSQHQRDRRSKRKTWAGKNVQERKQRNAQIVEDYKKAKTKNSRVTPHGFALQNYENYELKVRQIREIIKNSLSS